MKELLQSIFLLLAICLSTLSQAQIQIGKSAYEKAAETPKPLTITHLTGNLYVYVTFSTYNGHPTPANAMYLVTTQGVVMIDAPWDTTQFQPLMDSIESKHHQKVVLCIGTHFHADRSGGFEFLNAKGIPTYSSKLTYELCKKNHEKLAAHTFQNDTTFNIGDYKVETYYPGPGHTDDNIVIWFGADKVLYGGCFIKSCDWSDLGNMKDADTEAWPTSIRNVLKKYPKPVYVIPGHDSWTNNTGLQHTLKLLKQRKSVKQTRHENGSKH